MLLKKAFTRHLSTVFILFSCTYASHSTAMGKGFYLGTHIDYVQFKISNKETINFKDSSAVTLYAGYNFLSHIGVEAGFTQYDDFSSETSDLEVSLQQARLGFILHGKLHNNLYLFTKMMANYSSAELSNKSGELENSSDLGWGYEVGLDYKFNKHISINSSIAYNLSSFNDQFDYTANTVGIGIKASF